MFSRIATSAKVLRSTSTFAKQNASRLNTVSNSSFSQMKAKPKMATKRFASSSKSVFAEASTATSQATAPAPAMFCFQCEQTDSGTGCTVVGVCGKTPEVAKLQDLLVHACKGIAMYAHRARKFGASDPEIDRFPAEALFATLTNVNFDAQRFVIELERAEKLLDKARKLYENAAGSKAEKLSGPALFTRAHPTDTEQLGRQAEAVGVLARKAQLGDDVVGLQELSMYGLKGMLAYAWHAYLLGVENPDIWAFTMECLDALTRTDMNAQQLLALALKVGEINLKVMEELDGAHRKNFGVPSPTKVRVTAVKGKAIAVSGHDMHDLYELLKQTEGKGINVYTHGEMLPAHGYPELRKFKHLVGNYGSAWQNQKLEFSMFPGSILMTSNCIVEPRKQYKDRIFTTNVVGFEGVKHIQGKDYSAVIEAALKQPGFTKDEPEKYVTVGFMRDAVMGVAGPVIEAVKAGKIKHFFLIGGCDGSEGERNYFKETALATPKDTVILTLACGKYRFNKFEFGDIDGIPRLLDMGQCNDAYSAIKVASALAEAFKTDVNGLPLSFVVSWFEQKAVAVLLTLLHLGIKNIRLGPNLPAFATPAMMKILVDTYGIKPIGNVAEDMKNMMQNK